MKKIIGFLLCVFVSCTHDISLDEYGERGLSPELEQIKESLETIIFSSIRETGQPFNWNLANDETLFNGLKVTDSVLVIGYESVHHRDQILGLIKEHDPLYNGSESLKPLYDNQTLGYMGIKVTKEETVSMIRKSPGVDFVEVNGFPMELSLDDGSESESGEILYRMGAVLDPQLTDPDYVDQVSAFDGGLRTVMRRHNMETAYLDYGIFGEGIGVAIIDNGVLPERLDFFENNGYGDRVKTGYYNPLWFIPFTQPDGYQPQPSDVFGISKLFYDTYYVHGSEMIKMVLTLSPNANIWSVRGSTWTVILTPSQVLGISNAIQAMADEPSIRMASMSMGTIFEFNRMQVAIRYFHSKGKLFVVSAGSTAQGINDRLGVLFPGKMPETLTATALQNRESTGGEFVVGEGSHYGPEVDFVVENTSSSSVACSRAAGMISLIWSANPSISREELLEVLKQSSYFYQEQGSKDEDFGWGTIDVGKAVEIVLGEP